MRTSLNETKRVDDYLEGHMATPGRLLYEAHLVLDPPLAETTHWQKKVYELVRLYGRKKLREDLEAIHRKLFTAPGHQTFKESVISLFPDHRK